MTIRQLTISLLLSIGLMANATNTKTTVEQVTDGVELTTNVDYIVTGTTPFTRAGSVDIQDTDHAVLIIANIKPSKVLGSWMKNIYINGENAVDGTNCQVKMYGRGTIVFPYGKDIQPLTCYTGKNFTGESCSNYSEGHAGGYMKTLSDDLLNNQIRSFKLKRGYMVTFAIGTSGWGYSRCFIADQEDLEINTLPSILDQKISSYRIFKWFNAHKAGIGDSNDKGAIEGMNLSWCYRMWPDPQGLDYRPDCEYIPHHYKESWPGYAWLGTMDFACHIKGNNEPGNSADEEPCDVNAVLANWQEAMRTGMRLLSESSHDGSMGHLKAFIDSIDARGWRCDVLDLHCYWDTGFGEDNLKNYSNNYGNGRPIWISEWIWGASWNRNGAFANGVTDERILERTKEILNALNANDRVERYAYWNSESKARIYNNGALTELGKYYATMDVGQGYNASAQYIPTNTRLKALGKLASAYDKKKGTVTLSWSDPNWDVMSSISVQCKKPGASRFSTIGNITPQDQSSKNSASYSFMAAIEEPGAYIYRVRATSHDNVTLETNEVTIDVAPAQGTEKYQYGTVTLSSTEGNDINFTTSLDVENATDICMFMGSMTNKNTSFRAGNYIANKYSKDYFSCQILPWRDNTGRIDSNEEIPFLVHPAGNFKYGDLDCEVGAFTSQTAKSNNWTEVTEVTFQQPFPEGVTPIVLTEIRKPTVSSMVYCTRVFDITNTGFKCIIYPEESTGAKISRAQTVCYFAITPGIGFMDEENQLIIAAGKGEDEDIYGIVAQSNTMYAPLFDEVSNSTKMEQLNLYRPTLLTALQTNNYPAVCMLRRTNVTKKEDDITWTTGFKIKRIVDRDLTIGNNTISKDTSEEAYRDQVGWVALAPYKEGGSVPTAIEAISAAPMTGSFTPRVVNGHIYVDGAKHFEVYTTTGTPLAPDATLSPGIYVIKANGKSIKILIKK